jgi:acyl-coenzyme A synthetase/AMP-(fatty) acid ligase
MTEALSHCFTNPLHGEQRMGTVGLPSGIEADIVDGKLLIRGPTVFQSDWYDTGDLATRDELGYYVIQGRSRDQINVKGYKLNPVSIEKQLQNLIPDLGECVIYGQDRVHCLYTGSADKNKLFQNLIAIHTSCKPVLLEQVEKIPIGDSGKLSRSWLAKNYKSIKL